MEALWTVVALAFVIGVFVPLVLGVLALVVGFVALPLILVALL